MEESIPSIPGRWCFTDGSWKDKDNFLGQDWYSKLGAFEGLMRARNTKPSLSPFHSKVEAFLGFGMHEEFAAV